jgi:hypothetical protein
MSIAWLNLLKFLRKNYLVVFTVSLVALLASSYALYTSLQPDYVETKISVPYYSAVAVFKGKAMVTSENPIWDVGEFVTIPVYSYTLTPNYTGEFRFYTIPEGDLKIDVKTDLVYYYRIEDTPVWEKLYMEMYNSSKGDVSVTFTVNMTEVKDRINDAQTAFGVYLGRVGAEVIETVTYSGTIKGKKVENTITYRIPVMVESTYYSFSELNETKDFFSEATKYVTVSKPIYIQAAFLAATITSFVFTILPLTARIRYKDIKILDKLIKNENLKKYSKWISTGRLPEKNIEKVQVESLEDLINAASDMMERVFYDKNKNVYFFIHGGVMYIFRPEAS